jgi:hypothetical protein
MLPQLAQCSYFKVFFLPGTFYNASFAILLFFSCLGVFHFSAELLSVAFDTAST